MFAAGSMAVPLFVRLGSRPPRRRRRWGASGAWQGDARATRFNRRVTARGGSAVGPHLDCVALGDALGVVVWLGDEHVRQPGAEDEDRADDHNPPVDEGVGRAWPGQQEHRDDSVGERGHVDGHPSRSEVPQPRRAPTADALPQGREHHAWKAM